MSAVSDLDAEMQEGPTREEYAVLLASLRIEHAELKIDLESAARELDEAQGRVEKLSRRKEFGELLGSDLSLAEGDELRTFAEGLDAHNPLRSLLLSLWDEARRGSYVALVGDVEAA